LWLNLEGTSEVGRPKEVITLQTAMTEKGRQFFFQGKIGVTPSVAAPSDANPSDVTALNVGVGFTTLPAPC